MAPPAFYLRCTWLPSELLSEIFDRLPVIARIRCRCVCRSWRCVAEQKPTTRAPPPLEPPWLMFSDPVKGCNFYSVAEDKLYHVDGILPPPEQDIRGRQWVGSSEGWLITADERWDLHLLNPITRVQIPLPSILSIPCVAGLRDVEGHRSKRRKTRTTEYLFCPGKGVVKWSTTSSDSNAASWTVMLLFMPGPRLAYARSGDDAWTVIGGHRLYKDILLHDGLFYTLDVSLDIQAWGLTPAGRPFPARAITLEFVEPDYSFRVFRPYLVASSSRILLVRRERDFSLESGDMHMTNYCEVYRLDDCHGDLKWTRTRTLEDRAVFIGLNSCISLSTRDFPTLEGDCIYFADDHWEDMFGTRRKRERDIGACNIKDGTITRCYPQGIPKLSWPPPIWITPSLL